MRDPPSFIPSRGFKGSKPGYVFKQGEDGLGYYLDALTRHLLSGGPAPAAGTAAPATPAIVQEPLPEFAVGSDEEKEEEDVYEEEEEEEEEDLSGMSAKARRLHLIRKKMNKCRKDNQSDVKYEQQRSKRVSKSEGTLRKEEHEKRKQAKEEEMKLRGISTDKKYMMDTATKVEEQQKKKRKKARNVVNGWETFNEETLFKAYEKRLKNIPYTKEEYEEDKAADAAKAGGMDIDGIDALSYGSKKLSRLNVDRMTNELEERKKKREKFSRRREHFEDADISYINERNKNFNEKANREYDKYTLEIRQNLERGTAL